jgi:hypothetical protein
MQADPRGEPAAKRSSRRRSLTEDHETPFSDLTNKHNRAAVRAFRVSTIGLIPGLGLLFGPAAMVLGLIVRRRGRGDPGFKGANLAGAAILLGAALALTNWLGLTLMILGLRQ